jgi:hypothetical protein
VLRLFAIAIAIAIALALAGAGCGSSDEDEAKKVIVDFVNASADGDGERVCELLSPDGERDLIPAEVLEDSSCVEAMAKLKAAMDRTNVQRLDESDLDSARVEIDGDTATVADSESDLRVQLRKVDGEWRLDAQPLW